MRRKLSIGLTVLMALLVLLLASFTAIGAVTGDHTLGSVTYADNPPHSGDHSPVWQRCGFYIEPVGNEHAVHSLEHGAVWITYRPDLAGAQVDVLRALAQTQDKLLVSPYPGLPAPVVVSAWGQQMPFDAADDPALETFIGEVRANSQAPEPGGGCDGQYLWLSGATGDPEK